MNLRDLEYLVAVANHKHFGRAAKHCFVSQPALSMQLKKLEEFLGTQLFERTNKRVIVTDVGSEIAKRAQKILCDVEELKEAARASQNPFSGKFQWGAFPTLAPYLFPQIIPKIIKSYPELTLLLVEEKTDVLLEQLKSGKIDAALLALPIEEDGLEHVKLFEDPFLLAVSSSHKLAKRKWIQQSDLQNENILLLEEGHCLRNQALDICSLMGSTEQKDFRATSLETLRQMVAAHVGITLIPRIARRNNDGISYIPFRSKKISRKIALTWRKTSAKKNCCHHLAEQIKGLKSLSAYLRS